MFNIDPKRRSLIAGYCWPINLLSSELQPFEIHISVVSGRLLTCLREKKATIIDTKTECDNQLLQQLNVTECIAVPVLRHNHLLGILYADHSISKKPLEQQILSEITPIAAELGIALFHARQYDMEKKRAQIDPLSQLFNKRMINQFLTEIFQDESQRAHIAVGFVDIDRFKLFNDVCGHQAGDDVIKIVADSLRNLSRPGDFIGRYGGEEFIFVIKNTDERGAHGYAERIRTEIEHRGKIMRRRFHNHALTVSIGVAMFNPQYTSYPELIEVADQAMYRAKNTGRNRVVILTGIKSEHLFVTDSDST
jgi:diguanylate cyclase (GGDEF)-like protein